jgi:hypothetical protein
MKRPISFLCYPTIEKENFYLSRLPFRFCRDLYRKCTQLIFNNQPPNLLPPQITLVRVELTRVICSGNTDPTRSPSDMSL